MTLLVANRGEIAVRILDTAAGLGVATVAVYPADDADAAHVAKAGEAVRLPGTGPRAYLDVDALVAAAVETGVDLLHPGYGFASENPELARRCAEAGVRFVGPDSQALALFGNKTAARARATELGIPVPSGTDGRTGLAEAHAFLASLGAGEAVMVKALAGGGGRGMRPITRGADLDEALRRCASEARAAFGDDGVYVERLLPHARHVEVQILADGQDTVVLGDRDCSAQRRRQKLVETAPAPALPGEVRARLHTAARALIGSIPYTGLATVEFLVAGDEFAFCEVNPRLQVEHTITEEVTGLDLVELGLRVAGGATLAELGLAEPPAVRGTAVEARVNAETIAPDGTITPSGGTLARFQPPSGRGVRVDTHGYAGYPINPRYDSLLAKVIVTEPRGDLATASARAIRALAQFDLAGVDTNIALLQAVLGEPALPAGALDTGYVDEHIGELARRVGANSTPAAPAASERTEDGGPAEQQAPPGTTTVRAPQQGVVVGLPVAEGEPVAADTELALLEAMKMEHAITAEAPGVLERMAVALGDTVTAGSPIAFLAESGDAHALAEQEPAPDPDDIRPDLAETFERHRTGGDEARPAATRRRHTAGRYTARENITALLDPDSFVEYGALAIAAQRQRRAVEDLMARTPADGLVTGIGTANEAPVAVLAYDYTVLAGTQGVHNHAKTDRLLSLAARRSLPVVIFAEGGGGRPGDTDTSAVASLDVPTFRTLAELAGQVPTVAVVSGYCFAGNAALAGSCDVIIATKGASLGMGGPAMIEGGGLGTVEPGEVGPMNVQHANGVVDLLVADDAAAVEAARRYLSYFTCPQEPGAHTDQRRLRHLVPENRARGYPIHAVLEALFDSGSVLELRAGFGPGVITTLARLGGRPVGALANNPRHLGGAIDADAADKATRFLELCQAHRLPVISLCDTPGFMVGPEAERTGTVRRFGAMFIAGARLTVPLCTVVLRKSYGLGAMAMAAGNLHAPVITLGWPTGEFGGMGLEGAVQLGYRAELDAITDPQDRRSRYDELLAAYYERGKALSVATVFEIDDVIDPADTRTILLATLTQQR